MHIQKEVKKNLLLRNDFFSKIYSLSYIYLSAFSVVVLSFISEEILNDSIVLRIILFNYKGIETNVKCSLNDQNGDIIDKYIAKTSANNCFMSNGKKIGKEKKYKVRLAKKGNLNGKINVFAYDDESKNSKKKKKK